MVAVIIPIIVFLLESVDHDFLRPRVLDVNVGMEMGIVEGVQIGQIRSADPQKGYRVVVHRGPTSRCFKRYFRDPTISPERFNV